MSNDLIRDGINNIEAVGKVKIGDYTFKINEQSKKENSDWVYNSLSLSVKHGKNGYSFYNMMGGNNGADSESYKGKRFPIRCSGTKEENGKVVEDFSNPVEVEWDDRFDTDILKTLGRSSFITVGVESCQDILDKIIEIYTEKCEKRTTSSSNIGKRLTYQLKSLQLENKDSLESIDLVQGDYQDNIKKLEELKVKENSVYYKRFISEYDAIEYLKNFLQDGDVVRIKGKLETNLYNDEFSLRNKITQIVKVFEEVEEDKFHSNFQKSIYITDNCVVKNDNEKLQNYNKIEVLYPFYCREEKEWKLYPQVMYYPKDEDNDKNDKKLKVIFGIKGSLAQIGLDGMYKMQSDTVEVTEDDIPDEIKELIEIGALSKEDYLKETAVGNGSFNGEVVFIISKPHLKYDGTGIQKVDDVISKSDAKTLSDYLYDTIPSNDDSEDEEDEDDDLPF